MYINLMGVLEKPFFVYLFLFTEFCCAKKFPSKPSHSPPSSSTFPSPPQTPFRTSLPVQLSKHLVHVLPTNTLKVILVNVITVVPKSLIKLKRFVFNVLYKPFLLIQPNGPLMFSHIPVPLLIWQFILVFYHHMIVLWA
jgi:hypothetical protein